MILCSIISYYVLSNHTILYYSIPYSNFLESTVLWSSALELGAQKGVA